MRVFFYLDDLIVMARSREWAMFHTAQLITQLTKLGFAINWKKSSPIPHQQVEYLGVTLDAGRLRATLTESSRRPCCGRSAGCVRARRDSFDHHADFGSHDGGSLRSTTCTPACMSHAEVVYRPSFRSQKTQTTSGDHSPRLSREQTSDSGDSQRICGGELHWGR